MPFQTIEHPEGVDLDALAQEIRDLPSRVDPFRGPDAHTGPLDPWQTPQPRHRGEVTAKTFRRSCSYVPRHRAFGSTR